MVSENLIKTYKDLLAELALHIREDRYSHFLGNLENIDDDTDDIIKQFKDLSQSSLPPAARYWLSILRIMRMSLVLKNRSLENYELFMSAYDALSKQKERSSDMENLFSEIGDYLYRVDDLTGEMDRVLTRMVASMKTSIIAAHGVLVEANDSLYGGEVPAESDLIAEQNELFKICKELVQLIRIEEALERVRSLILKQE